uniref:ForN n=1 Tax=Streptomyces kaniharaensis TaxID=212423 RepID=A0A8A6W4Q3_9ACTN|nr:ForN [Streptomyces kaniharaensis]
MAEIAGTAGGFGGVGDADGRNGMPLGAAPVGLIILPEADLSCRRSGQLPRGREDFGHAGAEGRPDRGAGAHGRRGRRRSTRVRGSVELSWSRRSLTVQQESRQARLEERQVSVGVAGMTGSDRLTCL